MMNTKVIKLCDLDSIPTPADVEDWHVSDEEAGELVAALGVERSREIQAETAQAGDTVCCAATAGRLSDRTVLIYPGRGLPGAEAAEAAVTGAAPGQTVETEICGEPAALTLQRVLRRVPAAVDDQLVRSEGIDGVETVEAYREYIKKKTEEQRRSMAAKHMSADLWSELISGTEYEVDEAEAEEWLSRTAKQMFDMYLEEGIDPRIPEDGTEFLTDEQAIDMFKEGLRPQFLAGAMCRALCKSRGIVFGPEEAELYAQNGVTGQEAEDSFFESRIWDLLYNEALARLEGRK